MTMSQQPARTMEAVLAVLVPAKKAPTQGLKDAGDNPGPADPASASASVGKVDRTGREQTG